MVAFTKIQPIFIFDDPDLKGDAIAEANWGGGPIILHPPFWSLDSQWKQAGVLLHEMTHAYAGTDDKAYQSPWGIPSWTTLTVAQQLDNADSYEGFIEQYYIPNYVMAH